MKRARVTRDYLTRQVSAKATTDISRVIKAATNPAKANFFIRFTSPCCCTTREAQLIFRSHLVHCDGKNHAVFPKAILRYPGSSSLCHRQALQLPVERLQDRARYGCRHVVFSVGRTYVPGSLASGYASDSDLRNHPVAR